MCPDVDNCSIHKKKGKRKQIKKYKRSTVVVPRKAIKRGRLLVYCYNMV